MASAPRSPADADPSRDPTDAELPGAAPLAPEMSDRAAHWLLLLGAGLSAVTAFALGASWIDSTSYDATCGSVFRPSAWLDGTPHDCATVMPIRTALTVAFAVAAVVLLVRGTRRTPVTRAWKVTADVLMVGCLLALIVNEIVRVGGTL